MNACSRMAGLACIAVLPIISSAAGTCGFVGPCVSVFQRSGSSSSRAGVRMAVSDDTDAPKPYSDLPADWRSPVLPPMNIPNDSEGNSAGQGGGAGGSTEAPSEEDTRARDKYAAEALKAATRVQAARIAQSPPGIEGLQTENQRRRALPLSKLKRIKPKVRIFDDDEGEFRPLVPKTDRESVLRGEDYWIDYREEDAKAARKKARTKAPAPDQFAQSKMKAEIVNPYKQNWILAISLGIVAIAGLIRLDPGILDDPSIITFPTEL